MLKKFIYLSFVSLFVGCFAIKVKADDNVKAKHALKTIWLTYQSTKASSRSLIEPAGYITEESSGKIIGQNFLSYSEYGKFITIELNFEGNNIPSATFKYYNSSSPIVLSWKNDKVEKVHLRNFKIPHKLDYNENSQISGIDEGVMGNGKYNVYYKIEYRGDLINKVIVYNNKVGSKKESVNTIVSFEREGNKVVIRGDEYNLKKVSPKNISVSRITSYTKFTENHYLVEGPSFIGSREIVYNENNQLIKEKLSKMSGKSKKSYVEETEYEYLNNKLFRNITIETVDGKFKKKVIGVSFTLKDKPASVPNYEKTEGGYTFDEKGVLIGESVNEKYREKINGVWGPWKHIEY